MLHVGLNLIRVVPGGSGGLETYARELVRALCREAPGVRFTAFVCREGGAAGAAFLDAEVTTRVVPVGQGRRFGWVPGEQTLLPRLAEREGCHLVHSVASTAPATGRFRRVTTIHDLIYRVLAHEHRGLRFLGARWLVARGLVPLAARRSHRVITHSRAAQADLCRHLALPLEKIDAFPMGPGRMEAPKPAPASDLRARLDLGSRSMVLSVSGMWPHKNLAALIEAVALLPAAERPVLVVPGRPTRYEPQLRRLSRQRNVSDAIRFPGWVAAADLDALYAAAACMVFPSLYEGFGLPVLEAMRRGVPVACSNAAALTEVAGDAASFFDPRRPAEIAAAIRRVLGDPAEARRLGAAGRERAARFSWRETARCTLRSYARALGRPSLETGATAASAARRVAPGAGAQRGTEEG